MISLLAKIHRKIVHPSPRMPRNLHSSYAFLER